MINTFELKLAATDVDMDANNTSDANATASGSGSAGAGGSGTGNGSASGTSLMDMEFLEKRRGQCKSCICTVVSGFELIASSWRLCRQGSLPHLGYRWMVFDRRRTYR